MADELLPEPPRLATGVPGLDRVLGGGMLRGASYVVSGCPGSGKTVLASQVAFSVAKAGATVLYVTLVAETQTRLLSNLRTLSFFDPALVGAAVRYVSVAALLEGEAPLDALHEVICREARDHGASLVVLDSIGSLLECERTSPVAYRRFLRLTATWCALAGATLLLLSPDPPGDGGAEQQVMDGLVVLLESQRQLRHDRELLVRKHRGSAILAGRHAYAIDGSGLRVHPRLESMRPERPPEGPRVEEAQAFGVAGLDDMLLGGVSAGSVTALLGPPGAGKTLLGLHLLAEGLRRGEPAVYLGTYETPERLLAKAEGVGLPLRDAARRGALRLLWCSPTEQLLDEVAERLLAATDEVGARRVFVDGANGLVQGSSHPERFPVFFSALGDALRARGVTAAVSIETDPAGRVTGDASVTLSAAVENVVLVRYVEVRSRLHRLLSIVKVRDASYDPSLREFRIGPRGVEVASTSESAEALLSDGPAVGCGVAPGGGAGRGGR